MRIFCLILCALFLSPAAGAGGSGNVDTVLARIRERIAASDFRAAGRLVQVSQDGNRKSYKVSFKAHWFPDGLRLLCEVTSPVEARVRVLVQMDGRGHASIKVSRPGHATAALPFEKWKDGMLGTDFSFEDLVEQQFFWRNQELLKETKYGARDCLVIKSMPEPGMRTNYESVISYVDRQIYFPVYVIKRLRGSGAEKDFIYYGLRQTGGVWSPSQIEVKVSDNAGSSLLIFESGSARANLESKDFRLPASFGDEER